MSDKATIDALKVFGKLEDIGVCKIQFFKDNKIIAELEDKPTRIDLADDVWLDDKTKIEFYYTIPKLVINGNEINYDKITFEVDYRKIAKGE